MEVQVPSRDRESSSPDDGRSLDREAQDWLLRFCEPRSIPLAAVGGAVVALCFLLFAGLDYLTGGVLVLFSGSRDTSDMSRSSAKHLTDPSVRLGGGGLARA